ncbi:hypothetical protein HPB47_018921, partial [Ixodes persulcatus]
FLSPCSALHWPWPLPVCCTTAEALASVTEDLAEDSVEASAATAEVLAVLAVVWDTDTEAVMEEVTADLTVEATVDLTAAATADSEVASTANFQALPRLHS